MDCYPCGGEDPPGSESKGWDVETPLMVDHTNPVFDSIEVILGADIDDYVENTVIPQLQGQGFVWTAANQTGDANFLYDFYMTTVGQFIDEDDVVLVVQAHDPLDVQSGQGAWIHDWISIDFLNESGQFGYMDEEWEDTFHVDKPPYASNERTDDYWPKVCAGNLYWDEGPPPDLHLHTDGYGQGELNCWIAPMPCEWFTWQGAKLRIRDNVNNWRHSDDLSPGVESDLSISGPSEIEWGDPGQYEVSINANVLYSVLEDSILWSIQRFESGQWIDYGPHEDIYHQFEEHFNSTVPPGEDWQGPDFAIEEFKDCEIRVRARLLVCGETYSDYIEVSPSFARNAQSFGVRSAQGTEDGDWDILSIVQPDTDLFTPGSFVPFEAIIIDPDYDVPEHEIWWEIVFPLANDIQSDLPPPDEQNPDRWGPSNFFCVNSLNDEELKVRAYLLLCDDSAAYVTYRVYQDIPRVRIEVEPGSPRSDANDIPFGEFYLIDGPSIPLHPGDEDDWHTELTSCGDLISLETIDPVPPLICMDRASRTTLFYPDNDLLLNGQIKTKITWTNHILHIKVFIDKLNDGVDPILKTQFNTSAQSQPFEWVWDISSSSCGEYIVILKGYPTEDPAPEALPIATYNSGNLQLDMVKVNDLMKVAEVYNGDGYLYGGCRCPGRNECWHVQQDDIDRDYCGTVDCSAFMTQLLLRLNRNIQHLKSSDWANSNRVILINWDTIQWGDVIVWSHGHVGLFIEWDDREGDPPTAITYEARGGDSGVGRFKNRPLWDDAHPYTWADDVVFRNCQ